MLHGMNMAYDGMALNNKLSTTKHPKGATPQELWIHGYHPSKMTSFKTDSQHSENLLSVADNSKQPTSHQDMIMHMNPNMTTNGMASKWT